MPGLIDDRGEALVVLQQIIQRSGLAELVEPLAPDDRAVDDLMLMSEGEEMEIDLIDEWGATVAQLYVQVLSDPVDGFRGGLRGWRLADDVAAV
jgi:hypothetical protein